MGDVQWMVLGVTAVLSAWDFGRRWVDGKRFNQATLDELASLRRELERNGTQVQNVLQKLQARDASTAARMPRIGQR